MTKTPANGARSKNKTKRSKGAAVARRKSAPVRALQRGMSGMRVGNSGGGLDVDGRRWLRLLSDPCNADLVSPPYQGEGSGQFVRTKTIVYPTSTANDSLVQFFPAFLAYNVTSNGSSGTIPNVDQSPLMYACAVANGTTSNIYGTAVAPGVFGSTTVTSGSNVGTAGIYSGARCIAACVKVMYTGSELNRAGMVSAALTNTPLLTSETTTISGFTPSGFLANAPQSDRLGTRIHEYKWVPNNYDQNFIPTWQATDVATGLEFNPSPNGSTLIVAVNGAPTSAYYFELTACWEVTVQPFGAAAGSGLVISSKAPQSRNTLNDVLRVIGNAGAWALSPSGGAAMSYGLKTIGNVVRSAARIGASFA